MARLEINLLGAFELRWESGEVISLHSRKLSGLLAYLAMCPGSGLPRESLAALVWDRSAEKQAKASLRQSLAVLRKALDDRDVGLLQSDRYRVWLASGRVRVDAAEFQRLVDSGSIEALQDAVTLYRGRFLEGLSLDSEEMENWARTEGQRLHDLAMRALSRLLAHNLHNRADDAAIDVAHRILALDSLQEDAHRALIGIYVRQGARGEAARQYERYRRALSAELGGEPHPELRRLIGESFAHLETHAAPSVERRDSNAAVSPVLSPGERGAPAYGSERRFVTLMQCALVDAAALASRLDPEDLHEVTGRFKACCEAAAQRHGGHLYDHIDQSVTVCFGYPLASEHDAEHAIRAALDIVANVGRLESPLAADLRASVSIASGLVVVSDQARARGTGTWTILGDVPHVVAGLLRVAQPNGVVLAESTRSLLGALFECEDLGHQALAGSAAPVRAWRVLSERTGQSRFMAMRATASLSPLTDREEELELLQRRWQRASTGAGQVVALVGEPGIGKSRLLVALRERLETEPHTTLSYFCSPHQQDNALLPVVNQLEQAAGYAREDPPSAKLHKLEALLAQATGDPSEAVPLVAALLSIPTDERYRPLDLSPQRLKERVLDVLEELLVGLASRQPVLILVEDLHWSDPTTREFLGRVVERAAVLPVLLVLTQRPGTPVPGIGEPHVSPLVLKRLGRRGSEVLISNLTGGRRLPGDVLSNIVDKADGVPLFLEELTKNVLEAEVLDDQGDRFALRRPLSAIEIPNTLYDLLLTRLDRVVSAKGAAQEAAVIGRRFSYELLSAVSSYEESELRLALERLVEAELIYARGAAPDASFLFKHALVQEAAYASLLRADRAMLHGRIAAVLEERFPQTAEMEPEVLAHHFAGAGIAERAIFYWEKAGELVMRRWAHREAIAYFRKALDLLKTLPHAPEHSARELRLQVMLGQTWILAAGYAAPEVEAAFSRARQLCEETGDSYQLCFVLLGLWQLYVAREEIALASETADRLLQLARSQRHRGLEIEAHAAQVVTCFSQGAIERTLAHANEAISLSDLESQAEHIRSFGYDGRVINLTGAAWAMWCLGYPDQALGRMEEALAIARELAHPYSMIMALYSSAWLRLFRREAGATRAHAEQSIALSVEHGFGWPHAFTLPLEGWALAEEGRSAEGIERIRAGLAALDQMGHRLWRPHQQGLLAAALASSGQIDEARSTLREAIDTAERTGDREHAAELHRQMGELALLDATPGGELDAERCFGEAISVARHQRAKSWELRAAVSLARLWRDRGELNRARELLAPVYGWFTEGLDTPDLRDARALLDGLGRIRVTSAPKIRRQIG